MPPDPNTVPSHHTPNFMVDERAFVTRIKAMLNLRVDYLHMPKSR